MDPASERLVRTSRPLRSPQSCVRHTHPGAPLATAEPYTTAHTNNPNPRKAAGEGLELKTVGLQVPKENNSKLYFCFGLFCFTGLTHFVLTFVFVISVFASLFVKTENISWVGREALEGVGGGGKYNQKIFYEKKLRIKANKSYVHQEHWFIQIRPNPKAIHLRKERTRIKPPGTSAHLVNS